MVESADYPQSGDSRNLTPIERMNLKIVVPVFLLVLLVAVGGIGYFFYYEPREESKEAYVEAMVALKESRLSEAISRLERSFAKWPGHGEAGFALFDLIAYTEPERAEALLLKLEQHPFPRERLISRKIELAMDAEALGKAQTLESVLNSLEDIGVEGEYAQLLISLSQEGFTRETLQRLQLLRSKYPENRDLRYLEARIDLLREDPVALVRTKVNLFELLDRVDSISLRACILLVLQEQIPLFAEDRARIVEHLKNHPLLEGGLDRQSSEILRAMVGRLLNADRELAFTLTGELVSREDAEMADRLAHIEVAQALGRSAEVAEMMNALEAERERSPEATLLLAKQAILEEEVETAMAYLEEIHEAAPNNSPFLRYCITLLSQDPSVLSEDRRAVVAQWIFEHSEAPFIPRLLALQEQINLDPAQKEVLLDLAVETFGETQTVELARWLLQNEARERVLDLISESEALEDRELLAIRLDTLLNENRNEEALELLEKGAERLGAFDFALSKVQIHNRMEAPEKALEALREAMDLAPLQENPRVYFLLADLAELLEENDLQIQAYTAAYEGKVGFPPLPAVKYLSHLLENGQFERATEFAVYCRNRSPNNPIFINNDCYLQIIQENNLEACVDDMEALVEANPQVPQYRGTLALGQLLAGYPESALETLESEDVEFSLDQTQAQLVYAMVQAANGQEALAENLIRSINREALNPAEAALLEQYFPSGG